MRLIICPVSLPTLESSYVKCAMHIRLGSCCYQMLNYMISVCSIAKKAVKKKVGWLSILFVQCVLFPSHEHSCFATSSSFQDFVTSGSEEEELDGESSEDEDNPLNVKVK